MISVIMLTYNRETLIARAIESILAQTCRDFEFIIVDNGSTDRSGQIAEEYAVRDARIRVLHRTRGSIGAGRNTGLDAARGAYIAFIDDDDWAEPDFLEFLLGLIQESVADVAICGAADRAFDEKRVMSAEEALIELMWRKKYNMAFPTKLFRRELMNDMRFPEERIYDDIALMYRLLATAKTVAYYGIPKYTFYRHSGNTSAWTTNHKLLTPETLDEYLTAYRIRTEWLCEKFPRRAPTWQYFEWSFMISMVEKVSRLDIKGCEKQLTQMQQKLQKHSIEFLACEELLEIERGWMEQYIPKFRRDQVKTNTIQCLSKKHCTGCAACVNCCPENCISMKDDEEGFLYPVVDENKCTNCGNCKSICPVMTIFASHVKPEVNRLPECYAAWSKDADIRFQSASGGIFTHLAQEFLKQGGIVAGAGYDSNHLVKHTLVSDMTELETLRQSKYVQSETGLIYKTIEEKLRKDVPVLYAGTPCQCAGLCNFLQKEYDNLLLCDFICRGVNSPKVFLAYLQELEESYGAFAKQVCFKNKTYSWNHWCVKITFENGQEYMADRETDLFVLGFVKSKLSLYMRPSCYYCQFKGVKRPTDITMGDFWGIEKQFPALDTKNGVSLVFVQSEKGRRYFDQITTKIESFPASFVSEHNICAIQSVHWPKYRTQFYQQLESQGFSVALQSQIHKSKLNDRGE